MLKDYQIERRDNQVRVKIGSERTAFAAWSSQAVAKDLTPVPPLRNAERGNGGEVLRHRLAGPRGERGALRADLHAHLVVAPLDLVVFQHVEVDDDPHHAGPELRVADVLDAAAVLPVVQHRRRRQPRALQVDHEPGGIGQREVLHVDRALQVDHDLHAAGRRQDADGPDFAVTPPSAPSAT